MFVQLWCVSRRKHWRFGKSIEVTPAGRQHTFSARPAALFDGKPVRPVVSHGCAISGAFLLDLWRVNWQHSRVNYHLLAITEGLPE